MSVCFYAISYCTNSFVFGIVFLRKAKRILEWMTPPMPRSQINDNFIDKTFSIVANILLRIIPTTAREKEAFSYYRDGAIWFFLFFLTGLSLTRTLRDRKKEIKRLLNEIYACRRWSLETEQFLLSCIPRKCSLRCFHCSSIERKVTHLLFFFRIVGFFLYYYRSISYLLFQEPINGSIGKKH